MILFIPGDLDPVEDLPVARKKWSEVLREGGIDPAGGTPPVMVLDILQAGGDVQPDYMCRGLPPPLLDTGGPIILPVLHLLCLLPDDVPDNIPGVVWVGKKNC